MIFSLYANMAGFYSNSCKYKIYLDGFTNEYVKNLCILLYSSYSASLWTTYVLCIAVLVLLFQGCCVIDFHAKLRIFLKYLALEKASYCTCLWCVGVILLSNITASFRCTI